MSQLKKFQIYFLIINISFLFYYIGIAYYNLPTNDDWGFLNNIEKNGIEGFVQNSYDTWQGRFSYYYIFSFFLKIYKFTNTTIPIIALIIFSGISSVYFFLTKIIITERKNIFLLSVFVFNISILGALDFTTMFWICASAYYIIFYSTLFLLTFLFNKTNFLNLLGILTTSIIIGGGAEAYTSFVILFLSLYFVYVFFKDKVSISNLAQHKVILKLFFALIVMSISFLIMIKAPGNLVRMHLYKQSNTIHLLFQNSFKPYLQFLIYLFPKFLFYFLISIPFAYFGGELKKNGYYIEVHFKIKSFIYSLFFLFIFYYLALIPGVYATSLLTPLRALVHLTYLTIFFFAYWGFIYGYSSNRSILNLHNLLTFYLFFLFIVNSFIDLPKMREYRKSLDERREYLSSLKFKHINQDSIIQVAPLKITSYNNFSSYFYSFFDNIKNRKKHHNFAFFPVLVDEITFDCKDFRNVGLKDNLKLNFYVSLNQNKKE
jgi:hypothetical protein